jgi:hypothetical protein
MLTRSAASVRVCVARASRGEIEPVVIEEGAGLLFGRRASGIGNWMVEVWMEMADGSASILHLRRLVARISSFSMRELNAGVSTIEGRATGEIGMGVGPSCFTGGGREGREGREGR